MNTVALIIVSTITGSTFTTFDSMEECRAVQQLGKAEEAANGALQITDFNGILTIVTDEYETIMVTCAKENPIPKVKYDKLQERKGN